MREQLQIVVLDRHPLQADLLQRTVALAHAVDPGGEVRAPLRRHEVEVGEPGFAFQGHGRHAAEPLSGAAGGDGVAVADEEVGSGEGLHTVPRFAHQGCGVSVLAGG